MFSKAREQPKVVPKRNPMYQFRALVRCIHHNIGWMSDTTDEQVGDNAQRNVYIITHRREGRQILSLKDKCFFRMPPKDRAESIAETLSQQLSVFKAFRNYTDSVRAQVVSKAMLEGYKAGRRILQQGSRARGLYFLLYGKVKNIHEYPDPVFPTEIRRDEDEMNPGAVIGEVSLMYNEPRAFSVIALDDIEVLILSKKNFRLILLGTLQKQWAEIRKSMGKFKYFEHFTEEAKRMMCVSSHMVAYPAWTVLQTQDECGIDVTHFVVEGNLLVIQKIVVQTYYHKGIKKFRLYHDQDARPDRSKNVDVFFMRVCTLGRKSVFGLGEKLGQYGLICQTPVVGMVVPKYLLYRYNVANIWPRVVGLMDLTYPSLESLFEAFVNGRLWRTHKRKIIKSLLKRRNASGNSIHNTPVSLRVFNEIFNPNLLPLVEKDPLYMVGEVPEAATKTVAHFLFDYSKLRVE